MKKKALIIGLGQDSSYLSEFLLGKNYKVTVLYRRTSFPNFSKIGHIKSKLRLVEGDVTDYSSIFNEISDNLHNEIYLLAAQSHVATSFKQPFYTTNVDYIGCLNTLEAIKNTINLCSDWDGYDFVAYEPRFYFAATSEMFGNNYDTIKGRQVQSINTIFKPESPYAIAKLAGYNTVQLYRRAYHLHACSGICFNHSSPRRGEEFFTRKVTKYLGELIKKYGISALQSENFVEFKGLTKLKLGNINTFRDESYAGDIVEGMWGILQQNEPKDYIIASGTTHSGEEFLQYAFGMFNLDYKKFIEIDPTLFRPSEVNYLCGDSGPIRELGWSPKVSYTKLIEMMVNEDCK